MSGKYAQRTKVPESRSREEIERTLGRYGADQVLFGISEDPPFFTVGWRHLGRQYQYRIGLPGRERAQERRGLFRCVLLHLKSKLESVKSGVTTYEKEFMPMAILPNGQTVYELVDQQIKVAYESGKMPQGLPHFGEQE